MYRAEVSINYWVTKLQTQKFEIVTAGISIEKGCWLTTNDVVLMGVTISEYSMVGINSLVTKSIAVNSVAVGQPAKLQGKHFT